MLVPLLLGCAAGATASVTAQLWLTHPHDALRPARSPVSWAATSPTLEAIMDADQDVQPIRAVIVGGGYAGAKLAAQIDSIFRVTLVDEKNYVELSDDLVSILCQPWHAETHLMACRQVMALHRYYLKHANVITGTVDGVDEACVYLQDGRRVGYDLLFVATGAQRGFPFTSEQRTLAGRVEELRQFNRFLQGCQKVAVIGGGPAGTSLAYELASARAKSINTTSNRDKDDAQSSNATHEMNSSTSANAECVDHSSASRSLPNACTEDGMVHPPAHTEVHLFHRHAELLPGLPRVCRQHARASLQRLSSTYAPSVMFGQGATDGTPSSVSVHLHLSTHVTRVEETAPTRSSSSAAAAAAAAGSPNAGDRSAQDGSKAKTAGRQYRLHYDVLEDDVTPQRSILAQAYFGIGPDDHARPCRDDDTNSPAVRYSGVANDFDYVFAVTGSTPRPILPHAHSRDNTSDRSVHHSLDASTSASSTSTAQTAWSAACDGARWIRRILASRHVLGFGANDASHSVKPNILSEHIMPDGRYRVSTRLQLFARPNIFAVGRCNNIPATRCYGTSDVEVRTLFRTLNGITLNPSHDTHRSARRATSSSEDQRHSGSNNRRASRGGGDDDAHGALPLSRLLLPRMSVRLGAYDAVSSTPWTGGIAGAPAVHELRQDRQYLTKEFVKPVFFKQRDAMRVAERVRGWLRRAITDITDFSHCERV